MAVSENDLEILEVWLDGELSEEQVEALRRRVSVEPELSETLDRLRSDRQMRAGIFQALEPQGAEVETLVANVRRGVRKEELINGRLRTLRNVGAIAASIAVVFMAGWLSRTRLDIGAPNSGPIANANPSIVIPSAASMGTVALPSMSPIRPDAGTVLVSAGDSRPPGVLTLSRNIPNRPLYNVRVINPFGRVVFEGPIDKLDDLKELPEAVLTAEQAIRPATGNQSVPVNHENPLHP